MVSRASLLFVLMVFGTLSYFAFRRMGVGTPFPMYTFAFPPIATGLWALSYRLTRRWYLGRAAAADDLLCLRCLYDLRAIETGVCPECGGLFNQFEVQTAWRLEG